MKTIAQRDRETNLSRTLKIKYPELANKKLSEGFLVSCFELIDKHLGDISYQEMLKQLAPKYPMTLGFMLERRK